MQKFGQLPCYRTLLKILRGWLAISKHIFWPLCYWKFPLGLVSVIRSMKAALGIFDWLDWVICLQAVPAGLGLHVKGKTSANLLISESYSVIPKDLQKKRNQPPSLVQHKNQMIMWFQLNTCLDNYLITPNWLVVPARADLLVSAVLSDVMLFVPNCTLIRGLSPGSPTILTSCYWLMFQLGRRQINCVFSGRKNQTPHGDELDSEPCPAKHSDLQAVWTSDLRPHLAMANRDTLGHSLCNFNVWPLPAKQFPELFLVYLTELSISIRISKL